MYVLVINQKNVSLGMSWLLVSTFLGNQPPKNRWSGKAHGSNPAPKKLGLEIQWPQKFRKEWCWLPKLTQLVTSETWYCDLFGGDSHLSRWWPETRWDFAPKSGDFHFFLNSWISLDMLAQQISCVCVFIPRMAICGLELFPWGHTSVLTSLRHQTWHPWSR